MVTERCMSLVSQPKVAVCIYDIVHRQHARDTLRHGYAIHSITVAKKQELVLGKWVLTFWEKSYVSICGIAWLVVEGIKPYMILFCL